MQPHKIAINPNGIIIFLHWYCFDMNQYHTIETKNESIITKNDNVNLTKLKMVPIINVVAKNTKKSEPSNKQVLARLFLFQLHFHRLPLLFHLTSVFYL